MTDIACGNRTHLTHLPKADLLAAFGVTQHHHASVADVRRCFTTGDVDSIEQDVLAEHDGSDWLAEQAMEARYERWLDDGGEHREAIAVDYALDELMERNNGGSNGYWMWS